MRTVCLGLIVGLLVVHEARANVVLTELDLATGTIELTNISGSTVTGTTLEWCIPFVYGGLESGGYSFGAGETRTYTLSVGALNAADDLWIYKDRIGSFNNTAAVVTGVVWGANQAGQGRVDSVVKNTNGAAWAMNTDFVSTAGLMAGQTIQVNAPALAPNASSGWSIDTAGLGEFGASRDVDGSGDVDKADLNALMAAVFAGANDPNADLTGDGIVDNGDRDEWLREAGNLLPGDANLDGFVDGKDLLAWNANKFTANADWCAGDFDGSGFVDAADYDIWTTNKFQSNQPTSIPEPTATAALLAISLAVRIASRHNL